MRGSTDGSARPRFDSYRLWNCLLGRYLVGRPIRHVQSGKYYFITNRCALGLFLLRPDDECRRIIKGCLARAADKHDVDLVCFIFMSNHFHLLARFPELNMAEFMGEFQSQISRRLNGWRGRGGSAFPERYDDVALLDDKSIRDKVCYVLNNPVRAGLVSQASDWPGVTSMSLHLSGKPLVGKWLNGETRRKHRRRKAEYSREDAMEEYTVDLHIPDAFKGETEEERRAHLLKCVAHDRLTAWIGLTGYAGKIPRVLGAEAVEAEDWRKRIEEPGRRYEHRRMCLAVEGEKPWKTMGTYEEMRRETSRDYREASRAYRKGETAYFPHGTYPIGHKCCAGSADSNVLVV